MLCYILLLLYETVKRAEFLYVFEKMEAPANNQIHLWKSHLEKLSTIENLNSKSASCEGYSRRKGVLDEA